LAAQQIAVVPLLAQFPLWHNRLFVHAAPLAAVATQLPAPSHARFDPQVVPTLAGDLLHTEAPVLQLIVPGLHVVPQAALIVQATQLPVASQTWLVPQDEPADLSVWFLQVGAPPLQSKVPGLHADPQAAPAEHATQLPLPSQTMPPPQDVPAMALLWEQTCAPVLQLKVPGLHVVPHAPPAVQATQLPLPSQTWLVPQFVPADAFIWLHTAVPLVQS